MVMHIPKYTKFHVLVHLSKGNVMKSSNLKKSKKGQMVSTLILGARKSVKVKGQGQGHIRCGSSRGNKRTLLQVSILIRTEVMARKVF